MYEASSHRYLNYQEELALFVPLCLQRQNSNVVSPVSTDLPGYGYADAVADAGTVVQIIDYIAHEFFIECETREPCTLTLTIAPLLSQTRSDKEGLFHLLARCYLNLIQQSEEKLNNDVEIARYVLVQTNVMRVYQLAHNYHFQNGNITEWEDLVQNGMLGLLLAIDTYIPWYGYRFGTHATWQIRGKLQQQVRQDARHCANTAVELDAEHDSMLTIERLRYEGEVGRDFTRRRADVLAAFVDFLVKHIAPTLCDDERQVLLSDLGVAPPISTVSPTIRRRLRHRLLESEEVRAFMSHIKDIDSLEELF